MATTTTTSNKSPWEPIIPYLQGDDGKSIPGVLPRAAQNYLNAQWNPQMQGATDAYLRQLMTNGGNIDAITGKGIDLLTNKTPDVQAYQSAFRGSGPAAQASFNLSNLGLGGAPSDAYAQMLSGQADTRTLDPVVNAAMRRVTDNFNEQVMPSIRGGAQAAGQYGGSRQGIAEGIAMKGLAQSLGDMSGNMYNQAYNQAQGLRGQAAGQLGSISAGMSQNNAAMANQSALQNMTTANQVGLQNASNLNNMGQFNRQADLNQITQGANLGLGGMNANNANYQNQMNAMNMPNQFNNANLNQYANIVNQAAGQGGTATQSNPYYTNQAANNLGLAAGAIGAGQQIYDLGKSFKWWG